jgi:hypothetical protein
METASDGNFCFGETGRGQKFFDRKVGELDDPRAIHIDDGEQTAAGGQDGFHRIIWAPILAKFGKRFRFEVEREQVGDFLNAKRAGSHRNALEQTMGEFPVRFTDFAQGALVRLIEAPW